MKNEAMTERKEKLNKIFWDNLDITGIEHGTFERPVKAKIQGEIEGLMESEIAEAVAKERERILEILKSKKGFWHVRWEGISDKQLAMNNRHYNEQYSDIKDGIIDSFIAVIDNKPE